jgi:ribosomal protein S12 methylthiotransferase accessory factor
VTATLDVLPEGLRRAVSPYTGIVRAVDECLCSTSDPPLFRAAADVGPGLVRLAGSGGAGLSRREAAAAALGEALERYAAGEVPYERLVVASARELGRAAVSPERFALFSDRQLAEAGFPFRRFTHETRVPWVEGYALPGGAPAWLPAELVFIGDTAAPGCSRIGYATSSGAACSPDVAEALVRGLCELLERDAFMIVWANRLSLPLVDWAADERIVALDRTLFAPVGLRYRAVDLSAFHRLPSVLGVVRAPSGCAGALGVGAGTAPTVERAWWKALSEAFAARSAGAKLGLLRSGPPDAAAVTSFEDHIRYYAELRSGPDFLDAAGESTSVRDVPLLEGGSASDQVPALCARVEAAGSSAYAVDVTTPDVAELGLSVVKVLAPELCSLDVVHRARFLGGRRLYETAWRLGLRAGPLREQDVNPEPHPFP